MMTNTTNQSESQMFSFNRLTPENINIFVEMEMRRLQINYQHEEEIYVADMMKHNPVIVERRSAVGSSSSDENCGDRQVQVQQLQPDKFQLQQQRAESCRRSRINNKIKKAKTKFRHKFLSYKLKQTFHMLANIHEVISKAEKQVLDQGYTQEALQKLKIVFHVDRYNTSRYAEEYLKVD